MKTTATVPPLARSVAPPALDWEGVEPLDVPRLPDALGLSPEDRAALGLSAPHGRDLWPQPEGDAQTALAEALARNGGIVKAGPRK